MSNLQDICQQINTLAEESADKATFLNNLANSFQKTIAYSDTLLQGTSKASYAIVVNKFNEAQQKLREASMHLRASSSTAQKWLGSRSAGGSGSSSGGNTVDLGNAPGVVVPLVSVLDSNGNNVDAGNGVEGEGGKGNGNGNGNGNTVGTNAPVSGENGGQSENPENAGSGSNFRDNVNTGNYPELTAFEDKAYYPIVCELYDKCERIAQLCGLKTYKAHLEHHINAVIKKSAETVGVISNITKIPIDQDDLKNLAAAALFHDTGMDGAEKYDVTKSENEANDLRKAHPLSSAIHILENREILEKEGLNVDQMAAITLLHSKSSSGVRNMDDDKKINEAFDMLNNRIAEYKEKTGIELRFDSSEIIKNIEKFKVNAAALRIGDALGHDSSSTKTQSGGYYRIAFSKDLVQTNWKKDAYFAEIDKMPPSALALVENGKETIISKENFTDEQYYGACVFQFGEGNIASMYSSVENNRFNMVIEVENGMNNPLCTQHCIIERLEELLTVSDFFEKHNATYQTTINVNGDCDLDHQALYNSFKDVNYRKYGVIVINFLGGSSNG